MRDAQSEYSGANRRVQKSRHRYLTLRGWRQQPSHSIGSVQHLRPLRGSLERDHRELSESGVVCQGMWHVRVCGSNDRWFGFLSGHPAMIILMLCGSFPRLCRCKNQRAEAGASKPRTPEFEPKSPTYPPHLTSAMQPNIAHYTVSVNIRFRSISVQSWRGVRYFRCPRHPPPRFGK